MVVRTNPFAPQVPQFQMPSLAQLLGVFTASPGPGFNPAGMSDAEVQRRFNTNAGVPAWWPNGSIDAVGKLGALTARGGQPPAPATGPVDWSLAAPIISAESGGNPNARNPNSTAAGLGQFLEKTWGDPDLKQRAGFGRVDPKTWAQLRVGPAGTQAQTAMTQAYAQRNSEQWGAKYGTPPTPGQLYGMHFLDAPGFMSLVDKAATDPSADAAAMFPDAAKANASIFYKDVKTRRQPRSAAELVEEIQRRGGDTAPWTMPTLHGVDPNAAMGMMPMPSRPVHVDLPTPPKMDMPGPRPTEEQVPVQAWLDQLRQFAPKAFDEKAANEGRVGAVLAGIAKGAASVDARQGVGAMLAAMGAGAGQVQTAWVQNVKAEQKVADEAVRLFELGIARQGLELQGQNKDIRFRNADRRYQDQRDRVFTQFTNDKSAWETTTQEYLRNNGLDNEYGRDVFAAKQAKARVGLQATEFNVGITNEQISGQQQLDLKRFLFEDEKSARALTDGNMKVVQGMANSVGLNPALAVQNKDHVAMNALQGMAYIAAKNKPAAINALGREIVMAQRWDLLSPAKAKEIQALAKHDPELAAAAVGRNLNQAEADPKSRGTTLALAKIMAGSGLPLATTFLQWAQPTGSVQPGVK